MSQQVLRKVVAFFLIAVMPAVVNSQAPPQTTKTEAIRELLTLIGATKTAKTIFMSLIDQYSQALAKDSVEEFEKRPWAPQLKAKARTLTREYYTRVSQRLSTEVPQKIHYDEVVTGLYIDVYERSFTEDEIRALIEFYKSPVGRKFLALPQTFGVELQEKTRTQFGPMIINVTRQIVDEELQTLEKRAAVELRTPPRRKN